MNSPPAVVPFGISRRRFLAGGITVVCTVLPTAASAKTAADGFRLLRAKGGSIRLRGAVPTNVDCFDDAVPGPTLRVKRGDELKVRFANDLATPAAIHWHGLRVPNAMAGAHLLARPLVGTGASFDYRLTVQDAGTFWYRAIGINTHGLYAPLVVDEVQPPQIDRDVVLVLDDWRLLEDGSRDEAKGTALLTANSVPGFDIQTNTNERLRLRLINAGARVFTLRIDQHDARVMAIDGQPAQPFLARDGRVALAPGNRIDLFIDATLPPGSSAPIFADNDGSEIALARLVYGAAQARPSPLMDAAPLPANPLPERIDLRGALKIELPIESGSRLFAPFPFSAPPQVAFSIKRGRPVTLALVNRAASARVIHPHGHSFRLLDRLDDGWKPFWLDSILIEPGATARVAFVADNPGQWMVENRALADRGPGDAAWFEVS